jgi:uncharacterized RDD family membrane protein YckC
MSNNENYPTDLPAASLLRLLGSWLYDFLLLFAVLLLAVIIYTIPAQMFAHVDSTQTSNLSTTEFTGPVFYVYMFLVSWFFFAWFWTHGGQTLGLRTWSLRLQTTDGYALNWMQTLLRFLIAGSPWLASLFVYEQLDSKQLLNSPYQYSPFIIGFIGLFWTFIDKKNRSLQDILSHTQIVRIPKKAKQKK